MRRWIAWFLILMMLLSLAGCGTPSEEQAASSGEYVAGEEHQMSGDKPQKGETQGTIQYLDPTEAPEKDPQPDAEGEQQEEQQEQEEAPSNKNPSQKPVVKPDVDPEETPEEQKPDVTPEQLPEEQPEEEPEEYPEEEPEEEEEEDEEEAPPVYVPTTPSKPPVSSTVQANKLNIVSYNVRYANDGEGKTIKERAIRFKKVMDLYPPDIMGLQEVVPEWLKYLERDFGDEYAYINQWRGASSKESTPIFWRKDKFQEVDSGCFWLSDTPDEESKAENWGAKHYRVCMWVKLKIKATGKTFLFMNTHFDTKDSAQPNSAKLVVERAKALGGFTALPVFLTGDFNTQEGSEAYKILNGPFKNINKELNNDRTPTGNGYHEGNSTSIIDFCFFSSEKATPLKYIVLDEKIDGGYVSDHRGVFAQAQLK